MKLMVSWNLLKAVPITSTAVKIIAALFHYNLIHGSTYYFVVKTYCGQWNLAFLARAQGNAAAVCFFLLFSFGFLF